MIDYRARCEDLEEQVAYLMGLLTDVDTIPPEIAHRSVGRLIFGALVNREICSRDYLSEVLERYGRSAEPANISVHISNLNRDLRAHGIRIGNLNRVGWYLPADVRRRFMTRGRASIAQAISRHQVAA